MSNGFIKLHRKMFDNPAIMKDSDHLALWVWLLGRASWKKTDVFFKGQRISLNPGQGIFTYSEIASELHIERSKCRRIITLFKSERQMTCDGSSQSTLFTILRWKDYQSNDTHSDTQMTRKRHASDTPVNFLPIIEELEEGKNYKNNGEFDSVYADAPIEIHDAMRAFEEMRRKMKKVPFTEQAFRNVITKATRLANGDVFRIIALLNTAVEHGWRTVYEDNDKSNAPF